MRINRKTKLLISLALVFILLAVASVILKNIVLRQIEKKISSSFGYAQFHFSFLPPSIILEEARSRSLNPFFSAKKIAISISFRSLLKKERPLKVIIEHPVFRIYSSSSQRTKKKPVLSLPFVIERGVIREGEIYYWARRDSFQAKGINASFSQKRDQFWLKTEAQESIFYLASAQEYVTGRLKAWLEGQEKQIIVKRLEVIGRDGILKMEGNLSDSLDPQFRFKTYLQTEMGLAAKFLGLPFSWKGQVEGRGYLVRRDDKLSFEGQISSQKLVLNKAQMGQVDGKLFFKQGQGGKVEFNILKGVRPAEFVRINFRKDKIWGKVSNFQLDPIMNYISVPWPVYSPIWGNFTLDKEKLGVEGEFREESLEKVSSRFPLNGQVSFNWDRKDRIYFSSDELESSFGCLRIEGQAQIDQSLDMRLQGQVNDLKQARQFTSLILNREFNFPEIRGQGQAAIKIFGSYAQPTVQAQFTFSPGGFDRFNVLSVWGEAEINGDNFSGKFNIEDPFLKGKINLFALKEEIKADIQAEQGEVATIFKALKINLPLKGTASGHFLIIQKREERPLVSGDFSSSLIQLKNQPFKNIEGKFRWTAGSLSFSKLMFDLYQGRIGGSLLADLSSRRFALDIKGENINLTSINKDLGGNLFFKLKGEGLLNKDKASGQCEIRNLKFFPFKKAGFKSKLEVSSSNQVLSLKLEGNLFPGENKVGLSFYWPWGSQTYSAQIRGDVCNLDLILPWKGAKGRINYLGEIKIQKGLPQIKGVIDFKGPLLPLPRFAHALYDYSGLVFVENSKVSLRSFKAKLGRGDVHGLGEIKIGQRGLTSINLRMAGKNMLLSPLERTRALTDGTLNLIKDSNRFVLEGDFVVHRLYWRRQLNEKFIFSSRPYYTSSEQPGLFDDLTLNIHLRADDNAWIENSLGRIRARFDLAIGGNIKSPTILGEVEALEGDVYFQDRKFRILRGLVSFFNPTTVEPYLNFKGEAYIKNYRVSFSLTGFIDHLNPEFSSSPPLPPEDVLALLALGESFKRTYSYDTSTRLSTASFLSFQLSEEAKKRAGRLFSLDRFRIDPFILGTSAEMTARLTVGKKISRNIIILYSTNLTSQREEIARMEWELADKFSLVGIRDERGRFSLDVKIHKRF